MGFKSGAEWNGNAGGKPKMSEAFKKILDANDIVALNTIVAIMKDKKASKKDRIRAAEIVIERKYGKVTQPIGGDSDNPLTANIVILPAKQGRVVIPDETNSSLAT